MIAWHSENERVLSQGVVPRVPWLTIIENNMLRFFCSGIQSIHNFSAAQPMP